MYKYKFNGIQEKYESIHVPAIYMEVVNGEKEYYEHLKRVYSQEIDTLIASATDGNVDNIDNSITALKTMIVEHAQKLNKTVQTIQKLAAGEDADDSLVLSDDSSSDSTESDDDLTDV